MTTSNKIILKNLITNCDNCQSDKLIINKQVSNSKLEYCLDCFHIIHSISYYINPIQYIINYTSFDSWKVLGQQNLNSQELDIYNIICPFPKLKH